MAVSRQFTSVACNSRLSIPLWKRVSTQSVFGVRNLESAPSCEKPIAKEGKEEATHKGSRVFFVPQHKFQLTSLQEALRALRAYSISKFDETVEISLCCNLFVSKNKGKRRDPFRGTVLYPHSFGREPKVLVFAVGSPADIANSAGASVIGGTELVEKIASGELKNQFDLCLAVDDVYEELKPFQKTLRKNMPNPKKGTVVEPSRLAAAIDELKKSKEYKCDKQGNCNVGIGKLSFKDVEVEENLELLVSRVLEHREKQPKNGFIKSAVLSSTYGPGYPIALQQYLKLSKY